MKTSALLLALVLSTGCYTQKYVVGNGASTTASNKSDKRWDLHFFWGLIGKGTVAVNCPSGNATVITKQTAANALVKGLTGGIIAPSTTVVFCEAK
jgi:hypothetical protein